MSNRERKKKLKYKSRTRVFFDTNMLEYFFELNDFSSLNSGADFKANSQILTDSINLLIKEGKKEQKLLQSLINRYRHKQFKKKLLEYETRINDLDKSHFSLFDFHSSSDEVYFEKIRDRQKRDLLQKIVHLLNDLLLVFDESKLKEVEFLESRLTECDKLPPVLFYPPDYDDWKQWNNEVSFIESTLINLKALRFSLVKRKWKLVGRDIRQFFRRIIRFLFKNMDDQSGDNDNVIVNYFKHLHFITSLNFVINGQQTNYRTSNIYFKYQ